MGFLKRLQPLALLALRLVLGIILVVHGYPKVLGGEFHRHMSFVGNIGLPSWLAVFSAGSEFVGGILLLAGLATRVAGAFVTIEMLVIIGKVEWKHGLKGGYEFPLALCAIAFALMFLGAGPISLDWVFARRGEP